MVHWCVLVRMARINTTVPDNMKEWLEKQPHINASGLLQKAIGEEIEKSNSDFDSLKSESKDGKLKILNDEPPRKVAELKGGNTFFQIMGYSTDSDVEANLRCSECGQQVELMARGMSIAGGVCGCKNPPKVWKIEPVQEE